MSYRKYTWLSVIALIICLLVVSNISAQEGSFFSAVQTTPPAPPEKTAETNILIQAIQQAIIERREVVLGLLVHNIRIEKPQLSTDNRWGIAWMVLEDPSTGQILPGEPGLILARNEGDGWQVALPSDKAWLDFLLEVPGRILPPELKQIWLELYQEQQKPFLTEPLGGYLLPWPAGRTVWLSRSVAHDEDIPSGNAHFAFDFYIPQTMYNLHAAKAGTVWLARWEVPNNDHSGVGNYLVLQDTSTSPVTYQLYLHLAKDTIPPELRQKGTPVVQGQFIGMADNTGQSSGHHLHFQVHTNPNSYWGRAVDITFEDVNINGGRPRRSDSVYSDEPYCLSTDVCDDFQSSYVSGNTVPGDVYPPYGEIEQPQTGATISSNVLHLAGWAEDQGSGLSSAQFMAYVDGSWNTIGSVFASSPFEMDWDLCSAAVPDGPVSLALKLWDKEGNLGIDLPGLTHFTKRYTCPPPPPACVVEPDQVALFAEPNFSGTCVVLGVGDYPNDNPDVNDLAPLGDDQVSSIQVGSNVRTTLYADASFGGRSETFSNPDSNLEDNLLGGDVLSSMRVLFRSLAPEAVSRLLAPPEVTYQHLSSLSLSWRVPSGAQEFQFELDGSPSGWLSEPLFHLDSIVLASGSHTWRVRSRNNQGVSPWSEPATFSIAEPEPLPPPVNAPFLDDVEDGINGWSYTGLWRRLNDPALAHSTSHSWYYGEIDGDYRDGNANTGDLTSTPIQLPDANYILTFWYKYQTEGPGRYWDQRWVQISKDGGPFINVLQLYDDPPETWLKPTIDLSGYRGSVIRVRFHFETLDKAFNYYPGWFIDDIQIIPGNQPDCADSNNSPAQATAIQFDQTMNDSICPSGDVDYFTFSGNTGDQIVVDINTLGGGSAQDVDLIIFLLDSDGSSVLAEHDDEILYTRRDPHLGYLLTRSGTYYIKVRAWSHPSAGDEQATYTIQLLKDNQYPTAQFTNPADKTYLLDGLNTLAITANDNQSGISHVEFLWHSGNWLSDDWVELASDWDAQDGWSYSFDASSLPEQLDIAFYAKAYDWAGNWIGAGVWELGLDRTAPVSALQMLADALQRTAILLKWNATDNLSGIEHFELQSKVDSSSWQEYNPNPTGDTRQVWYIGEPGHTYGFRLRGVDYAGNLEAYPSSAETNTIIPAASELCSDADGWEGDNTPATATQINPGSPSQVHNFCNTQSGNLLYDEDWLKITLEAGKPYFASAIPKDESAAVILELYASDGTTPIMASSPGEFGESTLLRWVANESGNYYLRMRHLDGRVAGNAVRYEISLGVSNMIYLPLIESDN